MWKTWAQEVTLVEESMGAMSLSMQNRNDESTSKTLHRHYGCLLEKQSNPSRSLQTQGSQSSHVSPRLNAGDLHVFLIVQALCVRN
jgi:hypothetical protein